MSKSHFKAIVSSFNKNGKKMEFKLLISKEDIAPYDLMNALDMVDKKINVYLGDPQMSFDFEDEMDSPKRLTFVTDHSGVVTKVDEIDDDSTEEMEVEEAGEENESSVDEEQESENEDQTDEDSVEVIDSPEATEESSEETGDKSDEDETESEKREDSVMKIDKEQIESFILSGQAPTFEEIPYDFPTLLKRKHEGETWIQIATSIGDPSSKLSGAWSKYKKLITEHLKKTNGDGQGAA
ncbi:hypothetical protein [Brevibacillus laterosporus]|uniref:hypothetical protein n=1 Tax=Brevibacillus laterosporus TaxID=1465 RepID=UPI003D1DBBB0